MKALIKDIKELGWSVAVGGFFFHTRFPAWVKYRTVCRIKGHDIHSNTCIKCWRDF